MVPFLREHSSFVHFQGGMEGKLHPSCRKRIPFQGQYSPQPMPRLEAFLKGSDAERTSFKFPTKHLLTFTCFLPEKGFKWRFQNHLLRDVTSDSDESFTATLVFLTNLWWCKLSQLRFHKSHVASPKQHLELVSNIAGYSLANQISILDQNVHPRFMNAWLLSNCCSSISSRKSLISSSFFSHFCGRAKGTQIRRWVWKTGKPQKHMGFGGFFPCHPRKIHGKSSQIWKPGHFSQDGCSTGLLRHLNAFQEPGADLSKSPQTKNHRGFLWKLQLSGWMIWL